MVTMFELSVEFPGPRTRRGGIKKLYYVTSGPTVRFGPYYDHMAAEAMISQLEQVARLAVTAYIKSQGTTNTDNNA